MGSIGRPRSPLPATSPAVHVLRAPRVAAIGRSRRAGVLLLLVAAALAFAAAHAAPASADATCGSTGVSPIITGFSYSNSGVESTQTTPGCGYTQPGQDTFTVPTYVSSATFTLYGGGNSVTCSPEGVASGLYGLGQCGGETQATLAVRGGQVYDINVAAAPATDADGGVSELGGFGGGGDASGGDFAGEGGSGATDVRFPTDALTDQILVAGGAGGAGNGIDAGASNPLSLGGAGGGLAGGDGLDGTGLGADGGGGGNQQGGGPSPGTGAGSAGRGIGGSGGAGLDGVASGGGGGGGGYYGGGGGGSACAADVGCDGAGGGGGSGYISPTAANASTTTGGAVNVDMDASGFSGGNGEVLVTYPGGPITANVTLSSDHSSPVADGTTVNLTVTATASTGAPAQGTILLEDYAGANGSSDPSAPSGCPCSMVGQTTLENGTAMFQIDTSDLTNGLSHDFVAEYEDSYQLIPITYSSALPLTIAATPTVNFTSSAPTDAFANGPTYTVAASDSDGQGNSLPVSFETDPSPSSICSVSGTTVSFLAAGMCTIEAYQVATAEEPAAYAFQSFTVVAGTAQAITFTSSPPGVVTLGNSYHVSATGGGSEQPVILTASGGCSFPATNPTPTFDGNVTFNNNTPCTIDANQAAGDGYTAAPEADEVIEGQQSIAFQSTAPSSPMIGGSYVISAADDDLSMITFSVDSTSSGCTLVNDAASSDLGSDPETQTVSFTGSGTCIIDANAPEYSGTYAAAQQVQQSITIAGPTAQMVAFTSSPTAPTYGGSYSPMATGGGSDEPVVFSSATTGVCTVSSGTVSFVGIGTCTIDADQAAATGYAQAATQTQTVMVNPAPLTVTPSGPSIVYGASASTIKPSYKGLVNGDSATSLTTAPICSTTATATSTVAGSPYSASCSGAVDTDYTIAYAPGFVAVTPAPLMVSVTGAQTYGGTALFTVASSSGFVNNQSAAVLSGSLSGCSTSLTSAASIGSYAGTITGCGGLSAANYAISYVSGTVSVTKATLKIAANPQTRTYGIANPVLTATDTGLVNGDTAASLTIAPVCTTTAVAASAPGSYPITCQGASSPNYAISYTASTLTITKAPTTLVAAPASPLLIIGFSATLSRSSDHAAIAGVSIAFSVSGHTLCTATTNSSGVATCDVIGLILFTSSYQASYAGNTDYLSTTAPGAFQ